ncbi:MAG: CARDB domain-containing protein [Candidatus Bipolaricaulia bacterium]
MPGQAKLELEISATCENAVLLINGRIYSGRPVTLSVSLGDVVILQAVYRQLDNCGAQQMLHYFDRWDFNGEPYSKAPQQLRLRAGQVPFTANARVQAVYRSQPADFCDIAIDAQESLGEYLHGTFVDVRPFDILGDGGGATPFVRSFDTLTDVLLQASAQVSGEGKGYRFARWEIEGAQLLSPPSADPTLIKLRCRASRVLAHAIYVVATTPTGCPDLTIRHLYAETSQISPYTWLLKPRVYVENIGTATAPVPSTTAFYLNGQLIGEARTSPLAPGAGEQASTTYLITAGSYILTTVVDDKNHIAECNEDNNIKEAIVTVP